MLLLLHCAKLWAWGQDSCYLETLHTLNITFLFSTSLHVHINIYGSKSYNTHWFLVSLCYWGYWTVAELFVLDIYLYLNSYNLNQYTNMNNIDIYMPLLMLNCHTQLLAIFCPFYCPFTVLIVPFFLPFTVLIIIITSGPFLLFTTLIVPF